MINEINTPYSWEIDFYNKNFIPLWECKTHETKDLGTIYTTPDGSYIKAEVECMPAQFFKFEIRCGETGKILIMSTGSGCLSDFFDAAKGIADGMIVVREESRNEK